MYSNRTTQADIDKAISNLNKRYKFTDKTAVKFSKYRAYGGTQVVLKDNKSGGVKSITDYCAPSSACLNDLYGKQNSKWFNTNVYNFRRATIDRYKRTKK